MTELILSFPATGGIILSTVGTQGPASPGGGVADGDKGGIVVSGSGAIWTVKDGSITDLMLSASATALFAAASHTHSIAHITGLQAALDGKQAALGFTPENAAQKGVAGGYAGLDGTGKVPAAQLPAYVDDVVEAANFAALPGTGETGKIYVTLDTNKTLRWSGSAYVEISPSPGSTDSVTEGSVNLYFTAARARATDLTGYAAAGSRIALVAGDTFIGAMGKLGRWVADLGQAAFAAASTAGLNMLTAANAAAQTALLDVFTSGAKGLVPASGGGTTNFLRADGTFAAPPGGGGSGDVAGPASATDNALARFDTTTGKLIQDGVNLSSDAGEITFPNVASPAAAPSGAVNLFGLGYANTPHPAFRGPLDVSPLPLQQMLSEGNFNQWSPATGTGASVWGWPASSAAGTATAATTTTGSRRARMRRIEYLVTTAATTAVAYWRINSAQVSINGGNAWEGGFRAVMHGGPSTGCTNASHRFFMGVSDTITPTDAEPSSILRTAGIGYDAADTQVQFMTNDNSGTATKIALGASFPKPNADRAFTYRLRLYAPPGTTRRLYYEVTYLETGAVATGVVTTDLPAVGDMLGPVIYSSVGGVSAVTGIAVGTQTFQTEPF